MRWKSYRRLVRRLGLAIAIVAIAAPAAQAKPVITAAPAQYADDLHATVPHVPALNLTYADDLPRPYSMEQSTPVTDSLGRPLGPPASVQPTSDVVSDTSGFDWAYVGIGFLALGMMLLVGGALIIGRHNRRSRLAVA